MPVGTTYKINGWPNEVISFNYQLTVVTCPCGLTYALPEEINSRLLKFNSGDYPNNKATTYCPNGREWWYTGHDSELAFARKARKRAEDALAYTQDRLNEVKREADHERARANGYKGVVVKTKKRLTNGVCPYCNRSGFVQLGRHVNSKHPGESVPA